MTLPDLMWAAQGIALVAILITWRGRFVVPAVFVAALAILVLHGYVYWDHISDDAFISFRYSQNLARGDGLVWNPDERVEGYSNFLWVILLTGTELLRIGIVEPSRWLGFASTAGVLAIIYLLAQELTASRRDAEIAFTITALLLAISAPVAMWTFAGLEEPLFSFLVVSALYLHVREVRADYNRPFQLSAVVCLLALLTRPDGFILVGVIGVLKCFELVAKSPDRPKFTQFASWLLAIAVPFGCFIAWRLWYYDDVLPNTFYQKLDGRGLFNRARMEDGYLYIRRFWREYGLVLIFPIPFLSLLISAKRKVTASILLFCTTWMTYVLMIGGDFMWFFRFLVPVYPLLLLLSAHLLVVCYRRISPRVPKASAILVCAAFMLVAITIMHVPEKAVDANNFALASHLHRREIAVWLRSQDERTVVAVTAAGQVPYESQLPSIDMLGLTDRHIARQPPYPGKGVPGHTKGDARYVLDLRPDVIMYGSFLQFEVWTLTYWQNLIPFLPAYRDLFEQPDLWELYEPASVRLEHGYFNFLKLKSTTRLRIP